MKNERSIRKKRCDFFCLLQPTAKKMAASSQHGSVVVAAYNLIALYDA